LIFMTKKFPIKYILSCFLPASIMKVAFNLKNRLGAFLLDCTLQESSICDKNRSIVYEKRGKEHAETICPLL